MLVLHYVGNILGGSAVYRHTEEKWAEEKLWEEEQQNRETGEIKLREKVKIQESCSCGFPFHAFLQGRG